MPNRVIASHLGVAREMQALTVKNQSLKLNLISPVTILKK
jgi:hypothetical protein